MGNPQSGRDREVSTAKEILQRLAQAVAHQWPGFEKRAGQGDMMRCLAQTMCNYREPEEANFGQSTALVEAGTGSGKTLGYSLPAVATALATGKRVVISTATVTLQEQLARRDLPRLQQIAKSVGIDFSVALVMGRGRYACMSRLEKQVGAKRTEQPQETMRLYRSMHDALASGKWPGERPSWPTQVHEKDWSRVQVESGACPGRRCSNYERCGYMLTRKEASQANVVVANHSLVLSSLATDPTLFDPAHTIFIFDEAHHLGRLGLDSFASQLSLTDELAQLNLVEKGAQEIEQELGSQSTTIVDEALSALGTLKHCYVDFTAMLGGDIDSAPVRGTRMLGLPMARDLSDMAASSLGCLHASFDAMARLLSMLRQGASDGSVNRARAEELIQQYGPASLRLKRGQRVWDAWVNAQAHTHAIWFEAIATDEGPKVTVCSSALAPGDDLRANLWDRAASCVLTSATMTVDGSFDYFMAQTGLDGLEHLTSRVIRSPFDFERQASMSVVDLQTDPSNADEWAQALAQELPYQFASNSEGTLMLFCSHASMERVYNLLPPDWQALVLMQGQASLAELVAEHTARIEAGFPSILFGTDAFGEGMDLPGRLCKLLIIEKLPFAPPDSPVDQALSLLLETQRRSHFNEVSVPQATIKLKQWVGRLIRSSSDVGAITLMDPRILKKRYGQVMINSLPPIPIAA